MSLLTRLSGFLVVALFSASALASAVVESVTGDVRAGATPPSATALKVGQRVNAGDTVSVGAGGRTVLRFDDGQALLLNENSEFRIRTYSFIVAEPSKDSFVFDLLRGAMRSVTGALTSRNPRAYSLNTPQATIGIRGTDFMVAIYNPLAVSVIQGLTTVANAAGTVAVGAGSIVSVATAGTLAVATTAAALPAGVTAGFSSMSSATLAGSAAAGTGAGSGAGTTGAGSTGAGAGSGAGAGAGVAGGAAAGGLTAGTIAVGAAAAAAIAGALSPAETTQSTTGTTGTTGTR
jgi:hypothetical protein